MRIRSCGLWVVMLCAAVAGCAATPSDIDEGQDVQSVTSTSAFVLTVSGEEAAVRVTTTNVSDTCHADAECQFAFLGGSTLKITPTPTKNLIDCLQFAGWTGACAGQGTLCTVVINSDISVGENFWTHLSGCVPK
jgi:starvation-inducible outer membrane lipoprotein